MAVTDAADRAMPLRTDSPGMMSSAGGASDSIGRVTLAGWLIVAVFFGGIGAWAATAPLNGAVIGNAVVKIEGNRKSVQHLDGGIVKELRIREGDKVNFGDLLIVLDETQARAEYDVLTQQYVVLRATEARLLAELDNKSTMTMPDDLKVRSDDYLNSVWNGQVSQFDSRRAAIEGQRSVIRERINQLGSQIVGAEAQVKSYADQIASVQAEAESIRPLVERGLIARPRILQLELEVKRVTAAVGHGRFNLRESTFDRELPIALADRELTKGLHGFAALRETLRRGHAHVGQLANVIEAQRRTRRQHYAVGLEGDAVQKDARLEAARRLRLHLLDQGLLLGVDVGDEARLGVRDLRRRRRARGRTALVRSGHRLGRGDHFHHQRLHVRGEAEGGGALHCGLALSGHTCLRERRSPTSCSLRACRR